jgi:ubiquinone/menaquinone biosynthesis C-methylase UbiE
MALTSWIPYASRRESAFSSADLSTLFDKIAPDRDRWIRRNRYYYRGLADYCRFVIPPGSRVLEIGSGTGDLLAAVEPARGLGIDLSPKMVAISRDKYPAMEFRVGNAEALDLDEPFDYVILSDLIGYLHDIEAMFQQLHRVVTPRTRIIVTYYNYLWEPALRMGDLLRLKLWTPLQNWLSMSDIENLLYLSGFEVVNTGFRFLLPKWIPGLSWVANKYLARLPFLKKLCLTQVLVARSIGGADQEELSCSVIVPCRNEKGNVEQAVTRTPDMGRNTELIFVEGGSEDGTAAEIERCILTYPERDIRLLRQQDGLGKGDAVRRGFAAASGDVLIILDGDLTVAPEDLPKFFRALALGKGEFINGTRLVYPMERHAMRLLNLVANKLFSLAFTFLIEQPIRDTLCGTKVLLKADYEKIAANRHYFGDFDPFGDFDLLFGAAKLQMRIAEVPVRYHERTYGTTQIQRFRHGWLLIKMVFFAMRRLKFA